MNRIIYWHVIGRIIKMIAITVIALSLFSLLSTLIKELNKPDITGLWFNTIRVAPFVIYGSFPLSCVIGTVFALRGMMSSNELTIIRLLGANGKILVALVALPAFITGLTAIAVVEYVSVPLHKMAIDNLDSRVEKRNNIWIKKGDKVLYIGKLSLPKDAGDNMRAENVITLSFTDNDITAYHKAKQISYENKGWQAQKVIRWTPPNQITQQSNVAYSFVPPANVLADYIKRQRSQNIADLWRTVHNNQALGLDNNLKDYELWERLSRPFLFVALALVMTMLCLFSSPRSSLVLHIIVAVGIGLSLESLLKVVAFSSLIAGMPLWVGMTLTPLLLAILAAAVIVRRV